MRRMTALVICIVLIAPAALLAQHEHHTMADPAATQSGPVHIHDIPNVDLVDYNGRHVRFVSDLLTGKVVVINFIFTTCTTVCPALSVVFTQLQKEIPARLGRDVFLISVSIDPANDRPEKLRAWRKRFEAKDGWTMVTGDKETIDTLLKALGVYTPDFRNHQPVTLVGNAQSGAWERVYGFPPSQRLLAAIQSVMSTATQTAGGRR